MAESTLESRIAFLSTPSSYDEWTRDVQVIETHMSWVFLTDHFAYKLKKPVVYDCLDFSTLEARRHFCQEEVRLNQRLARSVYLGIMPLTVDATGKLEFSGEGAVVEWLILMRRLPMELSLEYGIRNQRISPQSIDTLGAKLAHYYARCRKEPLQLDAYRARFQKGFEEIMSEVRAPEHDFPSGALDEIAELMQAFLLQHAALFDQRVRDGRIIEGHGDLRAEHVYLENVPLIVDCLEFSKELRTVDAAYDLSFLVLECERLGAKEIGKQLFDIYRKMMDDDPPQQLLHYYKTYHACSRARLALWHLKEAQYRDSPKWLLQAWEWLQLAMRHVKLLG